MVLRVAIIGTFATHGLRLLAIPSFLICKGQLEVQKVSWEGLADTTQVFLCALEELGCKTTSFEPHARIRDDPDNGVLSVFRTEEVNMVKQGAKYCIISGPDSTTEFVFGKQHQQNYSCMPTDIYQTNHDSLYVAIIEGGFNLRSGRNLAKNEMLPPNSYSM